MSSNAHMPVLLGPVLEGLKIKPDGCYVDGTFGRGGHSREILKQLGNDGRLIAIDRDPQAIASVPTSLTEDPRFELVKGEIAQMETIIGEAVYNTQPKGVTASLSSIWSDYVTVFYKTEAPSLDNLSFGYTFMNQDFKTKSWWDDSRASTYYECGHIVDEKVTATAAGCIITGALG